MTVTFALLVNGVIENGADEAVNVSNANAGHLLGVLGYEVDWSDLYGEATAEDFMGRVLIAQAVNPTDEGVPSRELTPVEKTASLFAGFGAATVIDCGRSYGYTEGRLAELRELAQLAAEQGVSIAWC